MSRNAFVCSVFIDVLILLFFFFFRTRRHFRLILSPVSLPYLLVLYTFSFIHRHRFYIACLLFVFSFPSDVYDFSFIIRLTSFRLLSSRSFARVHFFFLILDIIVSFVLYLRTVTYVSQRANPYSPHGPLITQVLCCIYFPPERGEEREFPKRVYVPGNFGGFLTVPCVDGNMIPRGFSRKCANRKARETWRGK